MLFLTLTRKGFDQLRPRIAPGDALWVNAGVLSDVETRDLRALGLNLTTFSSPLDVGDLGPALETLAEHHPGQVIWVEAEGLRFEIRAR